MPTAAEVPALPTAAEVRDTIAGVERGLGLLKGLAAALERAEKAAARHAQTAAEKADPSAAG
jgi:hypothetical protein